MQSLKNVSLVCLPNGDYRLYDGDGVPVDAFNRYWTTLKARYGAVNTRNSYSSAVAHFLDYLYECGLFDNNRAPTEAAIAKTINNYPEFLIKGMNSSDPLVSAIAHRMNRAPLKKVSVAISAVNLFLQLAVDWAKQEAELRAALDCNPPKGGENVLRNVTFLEQRLPNEEFRIRQNSILGGSLRKIHISAVTHKAGIKAPRSTVNFSDAPKDFPFESVTSLIERTSNARDRCFYALLAATGVRESEALSLPVELIDFERKTIRIEDPNGWRCSQQYLPGERVSFKGRATAKVYILPHLKDLLFRALHDYLSKKPVTNHGLLLVKTKKENWGEPFIDTTNKDRNDAFRRAQKRIGVEPIYTIHSLRHFYGVFLKNYIPIPGRNEPGLAIEDVQLLMGHESLQSTMKYAKTKQEIILARLEIAERLISGEGLYEDMPSTIAAHYRQIANRIENAARGVE